MRAAERGAAGGRAAARGGRRARPAAHPGRDGTVRGGLRRSPTPPGSSAPTPSRATRGSTPTPRPSTPRTPYRRTPTCSPGRRRWGRTSGPPTTPARPRSSSRSPRGSSRSASAAGRPSARRWSSAGSPGPPTRPSTDSWLSRISAERIDEWAHGHPGERSQLARRIMPRLLEPPELLGEPLPTLRWLLSRADVGLRLTARHYIAPSLVGEAASLFGWQPRVNRVPGAGPGRPRRGRRGGQAASGARGLPAAHPARPGPARDGRGAPDRRHPGADQDRAADGR